MSDEKLTAADFSTPMMKQYMEIKQHHGDSILFFRMGDFYEMFLEDAKTAARELGITLTSRGKGKDGEIPMAGVPYHSAESYLIRLVKAGYKVAICEQVSDPKAGTDIVEREVIRVVTPSTLLAEGDNEVAGRHFLMTFAVSKKTLGIAFISPRSGEVLIAEERVENDDDETVKHVLDEYLSRFQPAEVLLTPQRFDDASLVRLFHASGVSPFLFEERFTTLDGSNDFIQSHYHVESLEGFGMRAMHVVPIALAQALHYLRETQKTELDFLRHPQLIMPEGNLQLSGQTIRNLELFSSIRSGEEDVSLCGVLDGTKTPMGKRLLRMWMLRPLLQISEINRRLDVVEWFTKSVSEKNRVQVLLEEVSDIERSASRLGIGVGNARDLVMIRESLKQIQGLKDVLGTVEIAIFKEYMQRVDWETVDEIVALLDAAIADEPGALLSEGGIIKEGYSRELDDLRETYHGGKSWITQLEQREKENTGITSLKISSNKVYGYYIEVSKSNLHKVPDHYIRRQTLTNAERFIIQELKEYEHKVLEAEDQANQLEYELYQDVVGQVLQSVATLQDAAELVATVDVLTAFGDLAVESRYIRPTFVEENILNVQEGRHPVVEKILGSGFVPNGIHLNDTDRRMMVLTGANMAGKSTYIRQVALLVIMAQIGCFVPAQSLELGIVDQIHTRIGAMDNLAQGLSTFMVEMVETANILNNLTDRSLVILDEIGRGTSTYDGLSIAWSVSEYVLNHSFAKVLFATHYFELTQLEDLYDGVHSHHMAVADDRAELVFLYRVNQGRSDQSYGVEVAERAGLPDEVVTRAREVLSMLQEQSTGIETFSAKQMRLFD